MATCGSSWTRACSESPSAPGGLFEGPNRGSAVPPAVVRSARDDVVRLEREAASKLSGAAVHAGLGGFIYLNVLDATFSFDAVIGAFALSNNMVVIALGLSIGAMFVRTMTLVLVEQGTLSQYRFLEHGAFWAILALGAIMLLSVRIDVPDALTGLVGAVLIGLALWRSISMNRKERA